MSVAEAFALFGSMGTVVGATWLLRTKLSDIEVALKGHVERDTAEHASLDARVVRLEEFRAKRP